MWWGQAKTFTTTNLVSEKKDSQRQDARKERAESGFTALRQLT